jgi:hypothetical protein
MEIGQGPNWGCSAKGKKKNGGERLEILQNLTYNCPSYDESTTEIRITRFSVENSVRKVFQAILENELYF